MKILDTVSAKIPALKYFFTPITSKFMDFSGRATRKEYWMFALMQFVVFMIIEIPATILTVISAALSLNDSSMGSLLGIIAVLLWIIFGILVLATLLPSLAIAVRRLHDIGINGLAILLGLVPVIGGIILLILLAQPGKQTDNEYGPVPKDVI